MPILRNTTKKSSQRPRRRRGLRQARHRAAVRRRLFKCLLFLAAVGLTVWFFCRQNSRRVPSDTNAAGLQAATRAGEEAASAVSAMPLGSMARENAVLDIRARETAIREAGFPTAADTFAASAHRRLVSDGILAR